jgi:hypothetical protein
MTIPLEAFDNLEATLRPLILANVVEGLTEDEIYAHHVGLAVRTVRMVGLDEHEVEVAASVARNIVAGVLAELREAGLTREEN